MRLETLARELAEICLSECLFPDCGCVRCRKAREVMEMLKAKDCPQITQIPQMKTENWSLCVECRAPVGKDERLCWACDQKVRTAENPQITPIPQIQNSISVSEMAQAGWSIGIDAAKEPSKTAW